jgi:hypothetical protein
MTNLMRNEIIYLLKFNLKKVINKWGITCHIWLKSKENECKTKQIISFIYM